MKQKNLSFSSGRLGLGQTRFPVSPDGWLPLRHVLEQVGLEAADPQAVVIEHGLHPAYRDFGAGPEWAVTAAEFVALASSLETPEARRWQKRSQQLLVGALLGDVRLAAQIAERAPDPQAQRWLAARLESTGARRELLRAVARHGGEGPVYGRLGSISNRTVLGKDSATIRQERGVKATRDGLSSTELLRLAYIDAASARAIEERGASGNAEIVRLHEAVARQEKRQWEALTPRAG